MKKKLKTARQNGFIFNQINKLTIKIYRNRSQINIFYYLKHQIPISHRQFFKIVSQSPAHVKTQPNDLYNIFHFGIRKWYLYINPQC